MHIQTHILAIIEHLLCSRYTTLIFLPLIFPKPYNNPVRWKPHYYPHGKGLREVRLLCKVLTAFQGQSRERPWFDARVRHSWLRRFLTVTEETWPQSRRATARLLPQNPLLTCITPVPDTPAFLTPGATVTVPRRALMPAWSCGGSNHLERLRAPASRGLSGWGDEPETPRYRIAFWLTLNQAVSALISGEKWPLGLSPSWRKLLINPPTTGSWEKWSVWKRLSFLSLHIKTSCQNEINWYGHRLNQIECPNIQPPAPRQHDSPRPRCGCFCPTPPFWKIPHNLLFLAESLVMNVASMFSAVKSRNPPSGNSTRPFIHTQEKELIDFEVKCWHLLLFKTRTLATVIHHVFSLATSVRQMKASCCQMRNAK